MFGLLRGKKPLERPGEKASGWYDTHIGPAHVVHYTESPYYFIWSVIADRVVHASVRSVLDIGCGTGQLGCLLRDKGLANYHGLDFSPERIALAKQACSQFEFSTADVFSTDLFSNVSYDCVISTEFLEHVERDTEVLEKIRPGTLFIGTVPNFPFVSHVRHFADAAEVSARYSRYFSDFQVDAFLGNAKGQTYYLMQGRRST